eukprot:g9796.t1
MADTRAHGAAVADEDAQEQRAEIDQSAFRASPTGKSGGKSAPRTLPEHEEEKGGNSEAAYAAAFNSMSGGEATVQPDNQALRQFLEMHSGVTDIDTELLKIASNQISAEDCRTGLFQLLQSIGGESFSGDECDFIIDASMVSAGLQISMEQWVGFTKTAGRIARLANYAKAF